MPVTIGEITNSVAVAGEGTLAPPAEQAQRGERHTAHQPALHDLDQPLANAAALARHRARVACEPRNRRPHRDEGHA
jgi:hypothetical protein